MFIEILLPSIETQVSIHASASRVTDYRVHESFSNCLNLAHLKINMHTNIRKNTVGFVQHLDMDPRKR